MLLFLLQMLGELVSVMLVIITKFLLLGLYTVDPRFTDGFTYRLFKLQTSLAAKFRFDLQLENRSTDQKKTKMEQKCPVTD